MAEQMCNCPLLQESGSMLAVPNGLTNAPGGGEEMNSLEVGHTKAHPAPTHRTSISMCKPS